MTKDTTHLAELIARRGRNMARLARAKAAPDGKSQTYNKAQAIEFWEAQVRSNNREIAAEEGFLGMDTMEPEDDMTTDEILKELGL